MKIVHISASDMGGAGVAAKRLHLALLAAGHDSTLITLFKLGEAVPRHYIAETGGSKNPISKIFNAAANLIKRRIGFLNDDIRQYYLKGQPAGYERFSFPYSKFNVQDDPHVRAADIIHLHWVADGMIDYRHFFENLGKPFVWTLHDMNPFTGGCHHSDGCFEYTTSCVNCLQVKNTVDEYIAARNLSHKALAFNRIKPEQAQIITPSKWLGELSKKSKLFGKFGHSTIPNISGITATAMDKFQMRKELDIDANAFVILFVANDVSNRRKGIDVLIEALNQLNNENLLIITVGNEIKGTHITKPLKQFGFISDTLKMQKLYAAADVFVLPSFAENFPNTIIESLLAGTPVIASRVGGIPEQLNEKNGILVEAGDSNALTNALASVITNIGKYDKNEIRNNALEKYRNEVIVEQHVALYKKLMSA